jgi:hypothetical protein
MADAFDTRVEAIRAAQEAKARDLTEQADAAQAQFFERVAPILLDIVRDRNAAVLMDSRAVLLSADRVDVTETAIAAIDAALGEGGPDPIISIDIDRRPTDPETRPEHPRPDRPRALPPGCHVAKPPDRPARPPDAARCKTDQEERAPR